MEAINGVVSRSARALGNIYSLWSVLALHKTLPLAAELAERYSSFMNRIDAVAQQSATGYPSDDNYAIAYYNALRAA